MICGVLTRRLGHPTTDTLEATDFLGWRDLEGRTADCSTSIAFDPELVAVMALLDLDDPSLKRLAGSWRTSSRASISTGPSIVKSWWCGESTTPPGSSSSCAGSATPAGSSSSCAGSARLAGSSSSCAGSATHAGSSTISGSSFAAESCPPADSSPAETTRHPSLSRELELRFPAKSSSRWAHHTVKTTRPVKPSRAIRSTAPTEGRSRGSAILLCWQAANDFLHKSE